MARIITEEEKGVASTLLAKARAAMQEIESYDQERVDRLCRAVAWATANIETATKLANMSVDESGMGGRQPTRPAKVMGILRDALRQKSMGVIEEIPEKGITKYGKPGWCCGRADSGDESLCDAGGHGDLCDQVQRRSDFLSASGQ